jgi:hypothetical protein
MHFWLFHRDLRAIRHLASPEAIHRLDRSGNMQLPFIGGIVLECFEFSGPGVVVVAGHTPGFPDFRNGRVLVAQIPLVCAIEPLLLVSLELP